MKFSLNDILDLSINNAYSLANIYRVYGFDIKIDSSLSEDCGKKVFSGIEADDLKKNVFDNILFNSVWAVTGVSSFEEFEKLKKKKKGTIKVTAKKIGGSQIAEIYDSGVGISKNDINNVFKKGFTARKSTGLGLYYALQTVKKLDGKIEVCSEKDKFTLVRVIL